MRYNFSLSMDMKEITEICESKGYKRAVVLKYLFENKELVESICNDMLEDNVGYKRALDYFSKNKINNGRRTIIVDLNEDINLMGILRQSDISLGAFMCYLITNNILSDFCNSLPNELKMKKYQ